MVIPIEVYEKTLPEVERAVRAIIGDEQYEELAASVGLVVEMEYGCERFEKELAIR
jgi:hypothetical protein